MIEVIEVSWGVWPGRGREDMSGGSARTDVGRSIGFGNRGNEKGGKRADVPIFCFGPQLRFRKGGRNGAADFGIEGGLGLRARCS